MKRIITFALILCLLLCGCAQTPEEVPSDKLSIVCANYPAYDLARSVVGDRAELTLLIKPGAELHGYEPTPKDMIRIQSSDLFLCNGGESEEWAEELTDEELNIVRMMDYIDAVEEEVKEGMQSHEEESGEEEEVELDEHVWTSPVNAVKIARVIASECMMLDAANSAFYEDNCAAFCAELEALDAQFREVVQNAAHKTLIFADRFPMRYFTLEYGLDYYAAFPGCSGETEPSAKTVAFLIDKVREEDIPAVLYLEFSNQKMADVICEDTGCKKLPFYSAHNVTAEQFAAGVTYLDLMKINLNSLKEALN